jgi:hypothetical protein
VLSREVFGQACAHLPLARVSLANIQLVAHEHQNDVGLCMFFHFHNPLFYVSEGLFFGDVVNQKGPETLAVMCRCDGFKAFLAGFRTGSEKKRLIAYLCPISALEPCHLFSEGQALSRTQRRLLETWILAAIPECIYSASEFCLHLSHRAK